MATKRKTPKRASGDGPGGPPALTQLPRGGAAFGPFAALYPDFAVRIVEIWNSEIPFVKEKVAGLRDVFEVREETWRNDLSKRFGLTDAEAGVAVHIIEGGSVDGYAERAKCSAATVRTHLKSVFRKTGISRQSELATLFLPSPFEGRR
jgi:DNA-binding CsgD family transcriptional regulator